MTRNKDDQRDAEGIRQIRTPELLGWLRHFRRTSRVPPQSRDYRAGQEINERIDSLAALLTGNREHFSDEAQGSEPIRSAVSLGGMAETEGFEPSIRLLVV